VRRSVTAFKLRTKLHVHVDAEYKKKAVQSTTSGEKRLVNVSVRIKVQEESVLSQAWEEFGIPKAVNVFARRL